MSENYTCNNYNKLFLLIGTLILSFGRKGGSENFYIFEALGLNFRRFLKQIRKHEIHVN